MIEMLISDILDVNAIEPNIKATKKTQLLQEMLWLLHSAHPINNPENVERELIERETLGSTGIGGGIAIPHLLTDEVTSTIMAFGISREGIKYNSIDGEPVQLVFLMLGPRGQESQHLRFLCSLSRLLRDARIKNSLLAARTKQEVKDLFSTLENQQTHEHHPQVENS